MSERATVFLLTLCVFMLGWVAGYLTSLTPAPIGQFEGRPVYVKLNGDQVEIRLSDKPMPCNDMQPRPNQICEYIPAVVRLKDIL